MMRHPIETANQEQANFLASLPDDQREFWARQFRISNATYCYQHQFNDVAGLETTRPAGEPGADGFDWLEKQLLLNPDQGPETGKELLHVYFLEWLEGLPDTVRLAEQKRGLDEARRSYPFRRYVLERNDLGMDEFLKRNLSVEDYAYHRQLGESLKKD